MDIMENNLTNKVNEKISEKINEAMTLEELQKEFKKYREQANLEKWKLEEENYINSQAIDDLLVIICDGDNESEGGTEE